MKDYNEMAKAVFERRDEYVATRKKQRTMLLKAGVPLCSLVLVCLVGLAFWLKKLPDLPVVPVKPGVSATENTDTQIINPEITDNTQSVTQVNPDPTEPRPDAPETDPVEPKPSKPAGSTNVVPMPDTGDKPNTEVIPPGIQDATSATDPAVRPGVDTMVPDVTEPVATEPAEEPTLSACDVPCTFPLPTDSWVDIATEPTEPTEPTEAPTGPLIINVGEKQTIISAIKING